MAMKPKDREKWEKIRKNGRLFFVVVYGALASGITASVFYALTSMLVGGRTINEIWGQLAVAVPIFCVGGSLWAAWIWRANEKKFLESDETRLGAGSRK